MISVRYDKEANAIYFQMRNDKVAKTVSLHNDHFLDINKKGKIVGHEVLLCN